MFPPIEDIGVTNVAIILKWFCFKKGRKPPTGTFRDDIVLETIQKSSANSSTAGHDTLSDFTIRHGSVVLMVTGCDV